jgi:hypothetical protein
LHWKLRTSSLAGASAPLLATGSSVLGTLESSSSLFTIVAVVRIYGLVRFDYGIVIWAQEWSVTVASHLRGRGSLA